MKLFWREHLLLVTVQIVQFAMILSIYWLDGYRSLQPALYSIFLGLFILGCYLMYHYYSRSRYYERLSQPMESLDASFQGIGDAPVSAALEQLLQAQYRYYQQQLSTLQRQQEEHLTFMDHWVHQMKTPLSVIELTVQNLDEPEFASIREEADRISSGLTTVLYMARLRAFEQDFHVRPIPVSQVIREVLHDHKRLFIRSQVYPEVHEMAPELTVESDGKWLFFMLAQLVNNAVKYAAVKNTNSEKVIITSYVRQQEAVLEVIDHGIGIPAEDLKRVFDPFFTGNNGRGLRESTGMGLYLTKEAASRLGHRIELESTVQSGTKVRIIFASYSKLTGV